MLTAAQRIQRSRNAARENGRQGGFKHAEYYDTEVLSESAHLQSLDVATPPGELANNELLPYGSANAFCDTDCKIPKN